MRLAEGCRWIEAKIIEDDEAEMDFVFDVLMDRWGDRRVPRTQQSKALPFPV